jgi:rSAM/selenodomain-associated transferase 1
MNSVCAVIIFAKAPEKGKVKTRLAQDTGEEFAAEFYKLCAEHTFSEILKLKSNNFTPFIYCSNESEIENVSNWAGQEFVVKPQVDSNLGERMKKSFDEIFSIGFTKAIIIGTDLPDVSKKMIESAASKLDEYDLVIGPATDGGYYLLGIKNLIPNIFDSIEWSTSKVLNTTMEKINSSGLKSYMLEEKIDIDTEKDLENWMRKCEDSENPVYIFVDKLYK